MAIDTLAKRNSVISINSVILPIPDGTIGQDDRQTLLRFYGGILAGLLADVFLESKFVTDIAVDIVSDIVTEIG